LLAEADKYFVTHEDLEKSAAKVKEEKRDYDGRGRVTEDGKDGDSTMKAVTRQEKNAWAGRVLNPAVLAAIGILGNSRDPDILRVPKAFKGLGQEANMLIQEKRAPADDEVGKFNIVFGTLKKAVGKGIFNSRFFEKGLCEEYCSSKALADIRDFSASGKEVTTLEELRRVCEDFTLTLNLIGHPEHANMDPMRGVNLNLNDGMEAALCDMEYLISKINDALQRVCFKFSGRVTELAPAVAGGGGGGIPVMQDLTGKFVHDVTKEMTSISFTKVGSDLFEQARRGSKVRKAEEDNEEEKEERERIERERAVRARANSGTGGRGRGRGRSIPTALPQTPTGPWCTRTVAIFYFGQFVPDCTYGLSCHFRHDVQNLKFEPQGKQDAVMAALESALWASPALKKACADIYQRDGRRFK